MKKYCLECVFFNNILRAFSGFYIETGEISNDKVEKCFKFDVCIKEKKPYRFIHESEIFM